MNRREREGERQTDRKMDGGGACLHGHRSNAALGLRPAVTGQWSRLQDRVCVEVIHCVPFGTMGHWVLKDREGL